MAKKIVLTDAITVGDYPHQVRVEDLKIWSFSFNAEKSFRDVGDAVLSIMIGTTAGTWSRNIIFEDAAALALIDELLDCTLDNGKTLSEDLLAKCQGATELDGTTRCIPPGTIQDIPAESEDE